MRVHAHHPVDSGFNLYIRVFTFMHHHHACLHSCTPIYYMMWISCSCPLPPPHHHHTTLVARCRANADSAGDTFSTGRQGVCAFECEGRGKCVPDCVCLPSAPINTHTHTHTLRTGAPKFMSRFVYLQHPNLGHKLCVCRAIAPVLIVSACIICG